jgi:hypothetical protein
VFYFTHEIQGESKFLALVEVMQKHGSSKQDTSIPVVKRFKPISEQDPTGRIIKPKYAVINVNDIVKQVGLVQYLRYTDQFYVIAPYHVFNTNMHNSAGTISSL